jgi:hypothetical protein
MADSTSRDVSAAFAGLALASNDAVQVDIDPRGG